MSKKALFGGLFFFTLITLLNNNISLASSLISKKSNLELNSSNKLLEHQTTSQFQVNNFSDYLFFKTSGSRIIARFAPQNQKKEALDIDKLAKALGYKSFNWVNYVEKDPHGIANYQGHSLSIPYNAPPLGGYQYDAADAHPYYWDIENCQNCRSRHYYQHPEVQQRYSLTFEDHPSDHRLKPGEKIEFVTHLVGIKNDSSNQKPSEWDILSTFKWQLTNDAFGRGKVSLIAVDLPILDLSPALIAQIEKDGGTIPNLANSARQNQNSFRNLQPQLQNHQNQHLDSHL